MFSFAKQKKVMSALQVTAPLVVTRVKALTPVEKAQALAVANSFMIAGGTRYGRGFSHAPMKLDPNDKAKVNQRFDAILEFAEQAEQIKARGAKIDGLLADDPKVAAYRRELAACEVAIVTAGAVFDEGSRKAAIESWRTLNKGIPFAADAVKVLLLYAKTHSLDPVVPINGVAADPKLLFSLASTLPPMFSKDKRSK